MSTSVEEIEKTEKGEDKRSKRPLDSLEIKGYRCFEDLTIERLGRVNLIVGKNNVGKTALLEAINIYINRGDVQNLIHTMETRNEAQRGIDQVSKRNLLINLSFKSLFSSNKLNINNSNKIVKDDISNYEKQMFRQNVNNNQVNIPLQKRSENVQSNISNTPINYNPGYNSNAYYQNQKRNYNQMNTYTKDSSTNSFNISYNNQGVGNNNFQTPMPMNNSFTMNQNDFLKSKKFKYN